MKAVLLAGGLGTRMREETEFRPKPMVEVGGKPVLWHIMKILSSYGIKDFVICAGYKAEFIANYFANYSRNNADFTVTLGDKDSIIYHNDNHDEAEWTVTVANTGTSTMTGGRIKRIREYIGDEPFFCTYGDGIANVDIKGLLEFHAAHGRLATMTTTRPYSRFGVVDFEEDGTVAKFREKPQTDDWINIGYFIFEPAFFDYIPGDDTVLEQEPLRTLAAERQLSAFRHEGFWQPMDTQR
ncbi:MAG: glucose-1-phosphate cytidylyltransferase, partial [Cellulomonadaceae bacterium]|nr:glucose-1-phosphate cytidylyltransferase [Cellulomonadaceae bacterium]